MLLSEKILDKFKSNTLTEGQTVHGLHLPHGTKSAKIVCHVDLDGVCSGISMVNSLVSQGIPKERITVEFAQYGDEKKDKNFDDRFRPKNNSQFVGITDFAKLRKCKPFDNFNKLFNFKGDPVSFVRFFKSRDFSKVPFKEFERLLRENFKNIVENKFTDGTIRDLYKDMKAYYEIGTNKPINVATIKDLEYQAVKPQFVSDHHSNEDGSLSGGKTGEIATGSPSEAEFFANKYIPGVWSQEDLKAISAVDSANYTEEDLKNTVFLQKKFTGENKKKNLAIIISTIYDNMVKKDQRAAKYVILNANPSLISLYNTTMKAAKLSGESVKMFNLLKDGNTKEAIQISKTLPKIFTKNWTNENTYKNVKPIMSHEQWQKKNLKDLADAKTGYRTRKDDEELESIKGKRTEEAKLTREAIKAKKGKLVQVNNFTMFNGKSKLTQYTRYMSSLYSVNGKRSPFTLRYWDSFFQVAKNPLYKGTVDFSKVGRKVIEDVAKYLRNNGINEFKIEKITDNMLKENGGHKNGIWSFQGFDQIKPSGKEYGTYWDDKEKIDRASKVGLNLPKTSKRFKETEDTVVAKYKNLKNSTMEEAIRSAIFWTNKLYPVEQEYLKDLETNDKDFEGK